VSDRSHLELRLLIEELCCDLSRFDRLSDAPSAPGDVRIDREVPLGDPEAFADIRVRSRHEEYFIEVKYGYRNEEIIRSLMRKYGQSSEVARQASRVVLVVDQKGRADFEGLVSAAQNVLLATRLELEVWDEERFAHALRTHFGVELGEIVAERLVDVRQAIDHAKGFRAAVSRWRPTNTTI
jgi:hypothetical protein